MKYNGRMAEGEAMSLCKSHSCAFDLMYFGQTYVDLF